ncbi:MAG: 16S rRNA (guanine(527)-N(7))-methyltransferase RsmG [Actinomycetota bacterium]|nr:16S rRNA (guanine(527)-N(7))-methyltransferase RsmG [Actinomycetota bacterium]MDD5667159.1 16S rRNA (guanine(527)-N(7))-methyltransferase RsmG [Actinomycetota bacterium]
MIGEDVSRETSQTLGTGGLNGNYSRKWLKDSGIMQRNFMQGRTIYKTGISMRKDGMAAEKGEFAERLRRAAERAAAKAGIEASEDNLTKMTVYVEELRKWNNAYNLVGRKVGEEGLESLLRDALSPLIIKGLFAEGKEVLDIGSGAGMPGIPLYLVAGPFPLTLVESQRKRITFLKHICRKLELEEARVYGGRLEEMARTEDHLNAYEVGMARAVMDPMRLVRLARPLLCEKGRLVLFLGKKDAENIRKAALGLAEKGFELEVLRSTQRIAGKENYLAVLRKAGR